MKPKRVILISTVWCPACGKQTGILDSRGAPNNQVRRRRYCRDKKCKHRFTTYELIPDTKTDEVREAVEALVALLKPRNEDSNGRSKS